MMKTLFTLLFVLIFSLIARAQDANLPFEVRKILNENFPAWHFDAGFDNKTDSQNLPVIIADWNRDGGLDYGILINHQGREKLIVLIQNGKSYKFWEISREAILVINQPYMTERKLTGNEIRKSAFFKHLPKNFNLPKDALGLRVLVDYGAYFLARDRVSVPHSVIFKDGTEVERFQSKLKISRETIGNFEVELQAAAMDALKKAIAEAQQINLTITPRDRDAARRSYGETVELWKSRVEPALIYWVQQGRIAPVEAERIRNLPPVEQIPVILELEEQGIFFSKDLSKSIVYSVAPPGTSQHLSLLAFDINEYNDPVVKAILAKYGWFQTVISDLPHFTYLGAQEKDLPALGLKYVIFNNRSYWIPKF